MANKIFPSSSKNINPSLMAKHQSKTSGSYYKMDRIYLSDKIATESDLYSNWDEFNLTLPKIWDDNGQLKSVHHPTGKGIKSLFSNTAAIYAENTGVRRALNLPLHDSAEARDEIRKRTDCSISALVKASEAGIMGRAIYQYSDFMYCKYLGKVPNNYMITLRKFPLPCSDHINYTDDGEYASADNQHVPDMGRLITWLGTPGNEMSNILKYTYKMPWDELKAPFDESPSESGGSAGGGKMGQFLSAIDGTYGKTLASSRGYGYAADSSNWVAQSLGGGNGGISPNLSDANRIVSDRQNVIASVVHPGGKSEGLSFEQDISLTFDYELRSYNGINGKAAMLDLLGNILIVTYLQGKFFPGSYRGVAMHTSNFYNQLDIFNNPDAIKSPANFFNSLMTSGKQLLEHLGFGKGKSPKEALKQIGNNLFEIMASGLINNLGRPQTFAASSLITPNATGQWHLTVGNPRNPILSIGNLYLDGASIEHYGPLGIDDFPTGLRVTVTLKHAKPRDSVAIEQMYMQGNYRIYSPMDMDSIDEMYSAAKDIHSSGKKANIMTGGNNEVSNVNTDGATPVKTVFNKPDVYMKFFGTNNAKHISITVGEAFTGADRSKKKTDGKIPGKRSAKDSLTTSGK